MRKGWTLVARFSAGDWKTQGSRVGVRTVPSLDPISFPTLTRIPLRSILG